MIEADVIKKLKQVNVSVDGDKTIKRVKPLFKFATRAQKKAILDAAGVASSTVYRAYEVGSISAKVAIAIAQELNLDPNYLTGAVDEQGVCTQELLEAFLTKHNYDKNGNTLSGRKSAGEKKAEKAEKAAKPAKTEKPAKAPKADKPVKAAAKPAAAKADKPAAKAAAKPAAAKAAKPAAKAAAKPAKAAKPAAKPAAKAPKVAAAKAPAVTKTGKRIGRPPKADKAAKPVKPAAAPKPAKPVKPAKAVKPAKPAPAAAPVKPVKDAHLNEDESVILLKALFLREKAGGAGAKDKAAQVRALLLS
jgi:hypothetical protein